MRVFTAASVCASAGCTGVLSSGHTRMSSSSLSTIGLIVHGRFSFVNRDLADGPSGAERGGDALRERGRALLIERTRRPLDAEALVRSRFWNDVEVHMVHRLMRGRA